jgi:hypothetical protein
MGKYFKERFKPRFPEKYRGDPTEIIFRSSWEFAVMRKFDDDPNVLQWSSEEQAILYTSPLDNKLHRYFPDFIVKKKTPEGVKTFMIEVKPEKQCKPPKAQQKATKGYINEMATFAVNQCKWEAARKYCARMGMIFEVWDEYSIGIKKRK